MNDDAQTANGSRTGDDGWAGRGFTSEWTDLPGEDSPYLLEEPDPEVFWHAVHRLRPVR